MTVKGKPTKLTFSDPLDKQTNKTNNHKKKNKKKVMKDVWKLNQEESL